MAANQPFRLSHIPSSIAQLLRVKDTLKVAGAFSSVLYSPYSDTPILQIAPESVCISETPLGLATSEGYPRGCTSPPWPHSEDEAPGLVVGEEDSEEEVGWMPGDSSKALRLKSRAVEREMGVVACGDSPGSGSVSPTTSEGSEDDSRRTALAPDSSHTTLDPEDYLTDGGRARKLSDASLTFLLNSSPQRASRAKRTMDMSSDRLLIGKRTKHY